MNNNEYLYHYTNVDTLALILANKTIRFTSLDQTDDLQEQEAGDVKNIGQFCYVSCWTEDEKESIPMWNMYTDMEKGVRIKLKKEPFKRYDCTADEFRAGLHMSLKGKSGNDSIKMIVPLNDMVESRFLIKPLSANILYQIQYTEEKSKLYPELLYRDDKYTGIKFGPFGKYKNLYWEFQKEWRYVFYVVPLPKKWSDDGVEHDLIIKYLKMKDGKEKQVFSHYDLTITDDAFSDMEITMSPHIGDGMKIIVNNLVKEYNPGAKVKQSELVGLL